MSSLRITSHNRAAEQAASASGETGRSDAPADGGSFAAALGTAGTSTGRPKDLATAAPGGNAAGDGDGTSVRKRADGAGDGSDAAALLGVPGLPATPADLSQLVPTGALSGGGASAGSGIAAASDPLSGISGAAGSQSAAGQAALAALAASADAGGNVPLTSGSSPRDLSAAAGRGTDLVASPGTGAAGDSAIQVVPTASSVPLRSPVISLLARAQRPAAGGTDTSVLGKTAEGPAAVVGDALADLSAAGATAPPAVFSAMSRTPAHLDAAPDSLPMPPLQPAGWGGSGGGTGADGRDGDRFTQIFGATDVRNTDAAAALNGADRIAAPALSPATATSAPVTADPANSVADQVSGQLVRLASSGSREMVMRLHPPELGDLTVRIAVNGRDVSAWFESPQTQVQAAITDGLGQLHADLGSAGYNLNGAWVGADASNARQQGSAPAVLPVRTAAEPPGFTRSGTAIAPSSALGMSIYV